MKNKIENEVLFKVDRFALTANNISYCLGGEVLGYWRFFPAEDNWGRIPAMGYAQVIASSCADIKVGERVWGFFPMSSHLKIKAGHISPSTFSDVSQHREGLSPFYAQFTRASANPHYCQENEDLEEVSQFMELLGNYNFSNIKYFSTLQIKLARHK